MISFGNIFFHFILKKIEIFFFFKKKTNMDFLKNLFLKKNKTNLSIKYNKDAQNFTKEELSPLLGEDIFLLEIQSWLLKNRQTKIYILYDDNSIVSFALLSKMNFDILNHHKNPVLLDFIYTLENRRMKGYATQLISELQKKEELNVFTNQIDFLKMLKKNNFRQERYNSNTILSSYP